MSGGVAATRKWESGGQARASAWLLPAAAFPHLLPIIPTTLSALPSRSESTQRLTQAVQHH